MLPYLIRKVQRHGIPQVVSCIIIFILLIPCVPHFICGNGIGENAKGSRQASYHTYNSFVSELNELATEYPELIMIQNLTTTWLGRTVWAAKISHNVEVNDPLKTEVLIMGAHHGNEKISFEVAFYILKFLLNNYATNSTVKKIVNLCEIWFVPMVNPDGYELNKRKNGRDAALGPLYGVDLNRNYNGSQNGDPNGTWGGRGSSHTPTSSTYCGPEPFSEPETRAIRDLDLAHNFTISLSYHSSGEEVYWPWGYAKSTEVNTPDHVEQSQIAQGIASRIGYTPMQSGDTYYSTGDSDDYLYGYNRYVTNEGMFPFTIELATIQEVPPEQIAGICEQNLPGAMYALETALVRNPVSGLKDAGVSRLRLQSSPIANTTNIVYADVTNYGSENENIPLTIEIKNKTSQHEIPPYLFVNTTYLSVSPAETRTIAWFWDVPARGNVSYVIHVYTTLLGDRHNSDDSISIECYVKGTFALSLWSQNNLIFSKPGMSSSIQFKLKNLGNCFDEYRLECINNKPWTSLDRNYVKLDYMTETTINLTYSIPSSAQSGEEVNATIIATSLGDSSKNASINFNIKVIMNPPVVEAGANVSASVFEELFFDASNSSGGDYFIISYRWDFGDGSYAYGLAVSHTYSLPGIYLAVLTITCNNGLNISDSLFVNVTQEYDVGLEIFPSNDKLSIIPGECKVFNISIHNLGNGLDDFIFEAKVIEQSSELYWQVEPTNLEVRLNSSEYYNFSFLINALKNIPSGEYMRLQVSVYSKNDTTKLKSYILEIISPEIENITFSNPGILTSQPGVTVTATLHVTNLGNSDEYLLLSSVPQDGWLSSLTKNSIYVSAGKSNSFDILITPPVNAQSGTEGTITILCKLQDSNLTYEKIVKVKVEQVHSLKVTLAQDEGKIFIKGQKGKEVLKGVIIENKGNGNENVLISFSPKRNDISIDNSTLSLQPWEKKNANMIFKLSENWKGTLTLNATASSIGYTLTIPVNLEVQEEKNLRKIYLIAFVVVFLILIAIFVYMFYKFHKRKKRKEEV